MSDHAITLLKLDNSTRFNSKNEKLFYEKIFLHRIDKFHVILVYFAEKTWKFSNFLLS